jgi:hypothetical protein
MFSVFPFFQAAIEPHAGLKAQSPAGCICLRVVKLTLLLDKEGYHP